MVKLNQNKTENILNVVHNQHKIKYIKKTKLEIHEEILQHLNLHNRFLNVFLNKRRIFIQIK